MIKLNHRMVIPAVAALLMSWSTLNAQDQQNRTDAADGGNRRGFDPQRMEEFRQRRMDQLKEQLEVKDDTEWKAIQPLIQKVQEIQQQIIGDRIRGEFRGANRGDRGGDRGGDGGARFRGGMFGGQQPSAEAQALEKAIESKASNADLKTAMAKLQDSRKTKQAELEKAQADLRKVLSVRQEAVLTASGTL